jgi:hypothetical protein
VCIRIVQRWFVASGYHFLTQLGTETAGCFHCPRRPQAPTGKFGPEALVAMTSRIEQALRKSGITTSSGALISALTSTKMMSTNLTFNLSSGHCCPVPKPKGRRETAYPLPATDTTPRPVKILNWDGKRRALRMRLKAVSPDGSPITAKLARMLRHVVGILVIALCGSSKKWS